MRSEQEMYELILNVARDDDRIRAVILNGSRANPRAPRDIFQDYDVVYIVTDVPSFKRDAGWIHRFGEIMIMQLPDDMQNWTPPKDGSYAYLVQFADGNRIDLTLYPLEKLEELERDSLSVLFLDKDGIIEPFPSPDESDHIPKPPTSKAFADCCNEFWWVCTYVAKGLWREEIAYAKYMQDQIVREQLMIMLAWYIEIETQFSVNPGKFGKYFKKYLKPELWEMFEKTYSDVAYDNTWEALLTMCDLFRIAALAVSEYFGFEYPHEDDKRVSAHLEHVRGLPKNAKEMY
jgi:aminoglycoside 6-adenylyltransferase